MWAQAQVRRQDRRPVGKVQQLDRSAATPPRDRPARNSDSRGSPTLLVLYPSSRKCPPTGTLQALCRIHLCPLTDSMVLVHAGITLLREWPYRDGDEDGWCLSFPHNLLPALTWAEAGPADVSPKPQAQDLCRSHWPMLTVENLRDKQKRLALLIIGRGFVPSRSPTTPYVTSSPSSRHMISSLLLSHPPCQTRWLPISSRSSPFYRSSGSRPFEHKIHPLCARKDTNGRVTRRPPNVSPGLLIIQFRVTIDVQF